MLCRSGFLLSVRSVLPKSSGVIPVLKVSNLLTGPGISLIVVVVVKAANLLTSPLVTSWKLVKAILKFRKFTDRPLALRGEDYAHAVQELNRAIERAGGATLNLRMPCANRTS